MVKGSIQWEHTPEEGLVVKIKPGMPGLFTGETRRHVKAARKEMLLAVRNLIDIAVAHMEAKENKAQKQGTKIEVE
jgi:hypothetical protein